MKKITILLLGIFLLLIGDNSFAIPPAEKTNDIILTTGHEDIITPPDDNAMREGTHSAIHGEYPNYEVGNLIETKEKIENHSGATQKTIKLIHRIVNYALSLVSFIALIVLLYAGFQMLTATGDDTKFKAGQKTLKKVSIAIAGIGISWFVVSFIFWILKRITNFS